MTVKQVSTARTCGCSIKTGPELLFLGPIFAICISITLWITPKCGLDPVVKLSHSEVASIKYFAVA